MGVDKARLSLFGEGAFSKLVLDRDFDVMAAWGSKWAAASSPAASWAGRPGQGQGRPKVRNQSFEECKEWATSERNRRGDGSATRRGKTKEASQQSVTYRPQSVSFRYLRQVLYPKTKATLTLVLLILKSPFTPSPP